MIQTVVLLVLAGRKLHAGAILDGPTRMAMARTAGMVLAMGVCVWGVLHVWPAVVLWREHALRLGVAAGVGMAVYGGMCVGLRVPELAWLRGRGG